MVAAAKEAAALVVGILFGAELEDVAGREHRHIHDPRLAKVLLDLPQEFLAHRRQRDCVGSGHATAVAEALAVGDELREVLPVGQRRDDGELPAEALAIALSSYLRQLDHGAVVDLDADAIGVGRVHLDEDRAIPLEDQGSVPRVGVAC